MKKNSFEAVGRFVRALWALTPYRGGRGLSGLETAFGGYYYMLCPGFLLRLRAFGPSLRMTGGFRFIIDSRREAGMFQIDDLLMCFWEMGDCQLGCKIGQLIKGTGLQDAILPKPPKKAPGAFS